MKRVYYAAAAVVLVAIILAVFNHVSHLLKPKAETSYERSAAPMLMPEEVTVLVSNDETEEAVMTVQQTALPIDTPPLRILADTKLVYETYGSDGTKTASETEAVPYFLWGMTEAEVTKQFEGWTVQTFDKDQLVLKRTVKEEENYRYILGSYAGYVAVFAKDEDGHMQVKEITERAIASLPEEEQKRLKEGLKIKSDTELMRALEDYES